MTRRELWIKRALFAGIIVYFASGYLLINAWTARSPHFYSLNWFHEERIPFYPVFIIGYLILYIQLALTYAIIQRLDFFKKTVIAFFSTVTIQFAIFLLFPVEYTLRPELSQSVGFFNHFTAFYYSIDLPYNCFPSIHCSNAFLSAHILQRYKPGLGRIFFPIAILVAISVVFVKQHYILDAVGGWFVAWAVFRVVWRKKAELAITDSIGLEPGEPT